MVSGQFGESGGSGEAVSDEAVRLRKGARPWQWHHRAQGSLTRLGPRFILQAAPDRSF